MLRNKKSLVKVVLMGLLTSTNVIWGGTLVHAEEPQKFLLDEMIVTATRSEKSLLDTPANAQVITAKDIENGGFTNAFEAVKNLGQVNVHTYQDDGGDYGGMMSRIRMRGIDNGTLVLVNGNPSTYMNNATLDNIPIDQIERIEIVKGAGSVLYGPQAMGGVVNIITKRPEKIGKVRGNVYGGIGNIKRDAGVNIQTDIMNIGFKESWNKDVNDAVLPGTTGLGTAINFKDKKNQQLYLDLSLGKDLTFSYGRTKNSIKYESGNYKNFIPEMDKLGDFDTTYNNYSLFYNNDRNGWRAVLGYNKIDKKNIYDKSYPKQSSDGSYSGYNMNLDVQKKFDLKNNDFWIVGANFVKESMENISGSKFNENGRKSYSLYQSYDFHPTDRLEFIIGLREYYLSKSAYQNSDFQLLPQVQGLYKINENSNYYFNVGKSFEMPSISSAFYYSDDYVINTNLKPQSGWSYEVGYKYDDNHRTLNADIFYMTVKDKFYWDKNSDGSNIMKNRDKWKNLGLEISYKQKLNENFDASLGLTVQNPVAKSINGSWVQDTSKYIINLGTNYHKNKFMADMRIFSYLGRENAFYNREHTSSNTKDHKLKNSLDLTVTLSYNPTKFDSFKLIGRNLLDREDALNNYEYRTTPINYSLIYERNF